MFFLVSAMKLEELQADSGFDVVRVRVLSKNGPRHVGRGRFVTSILVRDETSSCEFSVWGKDEASKYRIGSIIEIVNGWVKVYNGVKQISTGRDGYVRFLQTDDPNIPRTPVT